MTMHRFTVTAKFNPALRWRFTVSSKTPAGIRQAWGKFIFLYRQSPIKPDPEDFDIEYAGAFESTPLNPLGA